MLMPMDPPDIVTYNQKFTENTKLSGYGADVRMHWPCPFCAAPDFVEFRILEQMEVTSTVHTCVWCGRGARIIYTIQDGNTSFEIVQTGGEDPPDYLPPMRRV